MDSQQAKNAEDFQIGAETNNFLKNLIGKWTEKEENIWFQSLFVNKILQKTMIENDESPY